MISHLLAYALNADNKLVHIDSVKNGLECNCLCPGCKEPLIAKNGGKIKEHHFAHKSECECVSGYMTMIHILAQEILVQNRVIPTFNGLINVNKIGKEVFLGDFNIIPDVFATAPLIINNHIIGEIPFIVEVYVTHKVDEDKKAIIEQAGIPAMEIDLSKVEFTTIKALAEEVYNPKNWTVLNSKINLPQLNVQIPYHLLRAFTPRRVGSYKNKNYSRNYYRGKSHF